MIYPKNLSDNLEFRANLIQRAERDLDLRAVLREECRKDVLFFFNAFVFTYDPRRPIIKNIPFITYQYQDDVILWDKQAVIDEEDNLVEKSRDLGCTWIFAINDLHDWLFSGEKIEILWGSWKEEYVDQRGNTKTIFEKFRHALRNLPKWMLPKNFAWGDHDNYMRLLNPETGSLISGESTNSNFGRGGRFYRARLDEFAFWPIDKLAWEGVADSTNCRTALSTPNGASNEFAKLAKSDINKKSLHWTMHPLKNRGVYRYNVETGKKIPISVKDDPMAAYKIWLEVRLDNPPAHFIGGLIRSKWYDMQCERRKSAKTIAQELDIDYARSGMPFFDLRMLAQQKVWTIIRRANPLGAIPYGRFILVNLVDIDNKIETRESRSGWLRIFEMPVRDGQYVVSADISEGLEKQDESFGVVREKWTRNVVAACNGLYDPDDFALKLQKIEALYNKALTAPENNNHGFSVCSDLKKMDCHLYWTKTKNKKTGEVTKTKAGWTTTAQSRPEMLDQSQEEVRKSSNEIRDPVIIEQMGVFVHSEKNGKPEAIGTFKDDGVIAFAIGGQVIKEYPYRPKPLKSPGMVAIQAQGRPKFKFGRA